MVWSHDETKRPKKRLIMCCDGTWMNSDFGLEKPNIFHPKGSLQVPSNVTRISRCFKRRCSDGTIQIINYGSGVGSSSSQLDSITGGAFGVGLTERVRETYSYLCANYTDGDEIFLVGYSRGAFTARSVAGIISQLGLLTREGVEHFYPIFRDLQNWMEDDNRDPFPDLPFPDKPRGAGAANDYRERLAAMGYTRVRQQNGQTITIKALCVWDTVGSIGIPRIAWLERIGIRLSHKKLRWHDTALSEKIEHAFQALALDETRAPFSPAVWERPHEGMKTDLRQVWFPGNHGNCGGGWADQGIANCTLTWMMDQMASVGVEFDRRTTDRIFQQTVTYYEAAQLLKPSPLCVWRKPVQWADDTIYEGNRPVRPWGLGTICRSTGPLYWFSGEVIRKPSRYRQMRQKRKVKLEKGDYLRGTNESVHSSVRVRLACGGLGLNDKSTWTCPALANWELKRVRPAQRRRRRARQQQQQQQQQQGADRDALSVEAADEAADEADDDYYDDDDDDDDGEAVGADDDDDDDEGAQLAGSAKATARDTVREEVEARWMWKYVGDEGDAPMPPRQKIMWEEPIGPYERLLLQLTAGKPNVFEYAEKKLSEGMDVQVYRKKWWKIW